MDAASSASLPPPRKQRLRSSTRVKTFTGCSTCRSRHLRCDEHRPECRRCVKAGLKCSGYPGYRAQVLWKPVKVLSTHGGEATWSSSAHDSSETFLASNLREHDPLARHHVHSLEDGSGSSRAQVRSSTSEPSVLHRSNDAQIFGDVATHIIPDSGVHAHAGCRTTTVSGAPNSAELTSLAGVSDLNHETPEQRLRILAWTSTFPDHQLSDSSPIATVKRHLDELPNPHRQIQLVDYWINHLCDALQPIPESYNIHRNIFVPIALDGARSSANTTSAAVALFYLLCATSAFHLSGNTEDSEKSSDLMTSALYHHNRGISHLLRNLAMDDPNQAEAMLACLLLCITYEPSTVERSFWRTHFQGAGSWLRKTGVSSLTQTESATILYQSLISTAIFLRSQFTFDQIGHDEQFPFHVDTILTDPYYLLQVFGLAKCSLEAISRSISLVVKVRQHSCSDNSQCTPETCSLISEAELDRMEIELYLGVPKDSEGTIGSSESSLRYHYTQMFYYASVIYFKRILRSATLSSVQPLIEQSLHHMEALEACTSRPFSPFVWPIGVTCFEMQEIRLQRRALKWVDFIIKRSTLTIWPKFRNLLTQFWLKRAANDMDDIKWDEYLNDPTTPDIMMV